MSSRRQRSIPVGGRYGQVSLYSVKYVPKCPINKRASISSDNGLVPSRQQDWTSHYLNHDGLIYRCIYWSSWVKWNIKKKKKKHIQIKQTGLCLPLGMISTTWPLSVSRNNMKICFYVSYNKFIMTKVNNESRLPLLFWEWAVHHAGRTVNLHQMSLGGCHSTHQRQCHTGSKKQKITMHIFPLTLQVHSSLMTVNGLQCF